MFISLIYESIYFTVFTLISIFDENRSTVYSGLTELKFEHTADKSNCVDRGLFNT